MQGETGDGATTMTANQMATEMMAMQVPQDGKLYEIVSGAYNGSQLRGAELADKLKANVVKFWLAGSTGNARRIAKQMVEAADWAKIAERICG